MIILSWLLGYKNWFLPPEKKNWFLPISPLENRIDSSTRTEFLTSKKYFAQ